VDNRSPDWHHRQQADHGARSQPGAEGINRPRFIYRRDHGGAPPNVEYSLSAEGQSLIPVISAMHAWGVQHLVKDSVFEKLGVKRSLLAYPRGPHNSRISLHKNELPTADWLRDSINLRG
jgi:hypothetical protein